MQACDRCHARKTRCDRRIPQCGGCEKAGVACVHADKLRQRNLPRGYIDTMEALVQRLREENEELRRSLAASQAAAVAPTHSLQPQAETSHVDESTATSNTTDAPGLSLGDTLESDFALEVGYLSLTATGETRYLGNSSGLGLANIITTVLGLQANEERGQDEASGQSDSPPVRCISATLSDSSLPALATARSFIDAYFQHTHISFPLIHRPSFLATVKRIYEEEGFYENNPFDAFVFDMVLVIGSSNFNRFEDSVASSSGHFARANSKLDTVLKMGRLSQLKAILLISQHGIFSNLRDTSGSIGIWWVLGPVSPSSLDFIWSASGQTPPIGMILPPASSCSRMR